MRKLTGYAAIVVGVVGGIMSLYHVYARLTPAAPDTLVLRMIALAFCLTLAFLLFPRRATAPLDEESTRLGEAAVGPASPSTIPWSDLGLAALSIAVMAYFFVFYDYITTRFPTAHPLSVADLVVGTLVVLLVLEATRRTLGAALPVLCLIFIARTPWSLDARPLAPQGPHVRDPHRPDGLHD